MDEKKFQESVARLEEVAKVVEKLPSEIRSQAFTLLEGYVRGTEANGSPGQSRRAKKAGEEQPADAAVDAEDVEAFFGAHNHEKPADNVKLISAYLYNKYGAEAFSVDEVRALATEVGITIPGRPDATIAATREKGKMLFTAAGRGKFRPTVHGEAYLKAKYSVKKGTSKREPAE